MRFYSSVAAQEPIIEKQADFWRAVLARRNDTADYQVPPRIIERLAKWDLTACEDHSFAQIFEHEAEADAA